MDMDKKVQQWLDKQTDVLPAERIASMADIAIQSTAAAPEQMPAKVPLIDRVGLWSIGVAMAAGIVVAVLMMPQQTAQRPQQLANVEQNGQSQTADVEEFWISNEYLFWSQFELEGEAPTS